MTSVNTMMIIPSFVNMIGEIIYKATFDLFDDSYLGSKSSDPSWIKAPKSVSKPSE